MGEETEFWYYYYLILYHLNVERRTRRKRGNKDNKLGRSQGSSSYDTVILNSNEEKLKEQHNNLILKGGEADNYIYAHKP